MPIGAGRGGVIRRNPMPCFRIAVSVAVIAAAFSLAQPVQSLAQAPATPPITQTPSDPPPPSVPVRPAPVQSGDPFGEEVTLEAKTMVYVKGTSTWEAAFETLLKALKSVNGFLDQQGIKPAGLAMTIYTETDDLGFQFQAGVPVAPELKISARGDIAVGKSPAGKTLKFVHRGSYDGMDTTYEAITNHLDEKRLEALDMFIEEYVTDPVKTPEDKLIVNIYVPLK
jgi:effector-binding domain-containing protein